MNCGTLNVNPVSVVASLVWLDGAPLMAGSVSATVNSTFSGTETDNNYPSKNNKDTSAPSTIKYLLKSTCSAVNS